MTVILFYVGFDLILGSYSKILGLYTFEWLKNKRPTWCHLLFYFTFYMLNMFRTLVIHHQELATILLNYHIGRIVLGSMCVGDLVWLGWSGIRVAGWSIASACHILMSETCWAHKKWNKTSSDIKLVFCSSTITMMLRPINIRSLSGWLFLKINL